MNVDWKKRSTWGSTKRSLDLKKLPAQPNKMQNALFYDKNILLFLDLMVSQLNQ